MKSLSQLVSIVHPDPDIQRRARLLAILSLGMIVLAALLLPVALMGATPVASAVTIGSSIVSYVVTLLLAQRGRVGLGGWLFTLFLVAGILLSMFATNSIGSVYYLVLAIVTAGVLLRPVQVWWVLIVSLVGVAAMIPFLGGAPLADTNNQLLTISSAMLLIFVAFVSYLGGSVTERALRASLENEQRAAEAQARAEAQAHDLEAQTQALAEAEQRQRDLVATLETPTVAIAEGVLLAPIIGTIDSTRAQKLTARLLQDVADQRARLVVMDIAGVPIVDTAVAQGLIRTVQAVRLLGCDVVLTGIAPTVATTLTHLGIDLAGVRTARSPQAVLMELFEARDLARGVEHTN
jgi:rsbT co-antagonist protein RsbR